MLCRETPRCSVFSAVGSFLEEFSQNQQDLQPALKHVLPLVEKVIRLLSTDDGKTQVSQVFDSTGMEHGVGLMTDRIRFCFVFLELLEYFVTVLKILFGTIETVFILQISSLHCSYS